MYVVLQSHFIWRLFFGTIHVALFVDNVWLYQHISIHRPPPRFFFPLCIILFHVYLSFGLLFFSGHGTAEICKYIQDVLGKSTLTVASQSFKQNFMLYVAFMTLVQLLKWWYSRSIYSQTVLLCAIVWSVCFVRICAINEHVLVFFIVCCDTWTVAKGATAFHVSLNKSLLSQLACYMFASSTGSTLLAWLWVKKSDRNFSVLQHSIAGNIGLLCGDLAHQSTPPSPQ